MSVVVIDTVRTPRGKASKKGGLAHVPPHELLRQLLGALERRHSLDTAQIDEVVVGCATQTKEQGGNLAKTAALLAGWAPTVGGSTVNAFCASGLEAVNVAAAKIAAGQADLLVAGGVESVSRVPMFADEPPLYTHAKVAKRAKSVHMGISADLIATLEGFEREALDAYGIDSHARAAAAWDDGRFDASLVPIEVEEHETLRHDEQVRRSVTTETAARLPLLFETVGAAGQDAVAAIRYPAADPIQHRHSAASSPALADGAGLVLLASEAKANALGLPIRARLKAAASTSVEPVIMLTAGQTAVEKAVERAGLTLGEVDLFEVAEAFAATCLKFRRDLDVDRDRFNVNGGTIAMGHAFGATGAILVATMLDELMRREAKHGVVAVSGAAGLGVATVFERVAA